MQTSLFRLSPALAGYFSKGRTSVGRSEKTKQDQSLCFSVCQLFDHDLAHLSLNGLHFYIRDGILTVQGTLKDNIAKETVFKLLESIAGIKEIVDMIDLLEA
ncbi:MAG: hypothetical protein JNN12_17610 [Bacteroidetes Order II. Incertae sedis bacterium]|nr:hypothetical protein [Bacteroidetes Order II. bacterium]